MLSVAKLTVGQEAYYEQQVAAGLDDYYAGRGESPGIWAGRSAELLGLAGVVEDGELGTLLRAVDPASGARLRTPVRERTITVRVLDAESGEWREEAKRLAPVSGFDLVFSCPKSVSIVHALTDDERVRSAISEAHEASWQAALGYLEREACVVRRGRGGAVREHGEGFVAAAFRHRTSRAQDPHLHTHVIVANLARSVDGEWRALDGEAILCTYRLAAGYLYEANLRHELEQRLGVDWTEPVKGMAELEGVPEEAMRAFSTRRQSLLEHMEARGSEGFAASRVAALVTREAKEQVDLPRLREEWKARAAEHGLGRRELRELVGPPRPARVIDLVEAAEQLLGRDGLTATRTTFTMPELVCAVAGAVRPGASVDDVVGAAEQLATFPGVELIEPEHAPGRPARFTTRELLDVEREALEIALAGRDVGALRAAPGGVPIKERAGLTNEQRALVREACMSRDRVVCAVGVAGSGKTTALRVLGAAYRQAGIPVFGAAPSGRAADELATATGIRSTTMHRLLLDAEREGGLPRGCVLVVDEAGMAETRVLTPLLRLIDDAGGKTILVGDPGQLPAVGAGGLFPALCDRLGAIGLSENRRQHDPAERDALARLRAGDPELYLSHAVSSGRLHLEDGATSAKSRLLEDWWRAARHDIGGAVMLGYRRDDVRELNEAARLLMLRAAQLGPEALQFGRREFRVGDRAICGQNDARCDVRNGTRGTVVDLNLANQTLSFQTDAGALRRINAQYAAGHLNHAYALTGHAAQGATVDRAFVLLRDGGALREWGYVACSRARTETHLYVAGEGPEGEQHGSLLAPRDPAARLASALQRSGAEQLASVQTRPEASEVTQRALERCRRQREQALATAEQRLSAAENELRGLGRLGRRRQRTELQAEISHQRTAIRLARTQLTKLPLERPEPRPTRAPWTRLESESRVLTRTCERTRELGLEL
ncbi:MAG: relaxase domain-containing protein [Actinomycetota bacterium]|nr:relaxase domain-containing protein [Actinomycetota bacterium]